MTTSDPSPQANVTEVEVIKSLEQRGLQGLDSLSLEELQLLTERKRKQIHLEATEKKAKLESEISSVEAALGFADLSQFTPPPPPTPKN